MWTKAVEEFLRRFTYTAEMYWASYTDWSRGEALEGNRWSRSGFGGTYTMMALMWFQHHYRPGTTVYRPSVILRALLTEAAKVSA